MTIQAKFIAVKLNGCGPCIAFEASRVWEQLLGDAELTSKVKLEKYEVSKVDRGLQGADPVYVALANKNGGFPFFYIHEISDKNTGIPYKGPRSYVEMKKWILANIPSRGIASKTPQVRDSVSPATLFSTKSVMDKGIDRYASVRAIHRNTLNSLSLKNLNMTQIASASVAVPISQSPISQSEPIHSAPKIIGRIDEVTSVPVAKPDIKSMNPVRAMSAPRLPSAKMITNIQDHPVPNTDTISSVHSDTFKSPTGKKLTTSISLQGDSFVSNDFPSTLSEKNRKRGVDPAYIGRPFHPLYASNPESTSSERQTFTFRAVSSRR